MIFSNCEFNNEYKEISKYNQGNIKAITYQGLNIGNMKTKVFAYIGFPEKTADEKSPAVILVHGGGGHAYFNWVKMWNDKGYAAIAMDTTGFYPIVSDAGSNEGDNIKWTHGLTDEFKEECYTDAPDNDGMANSDKSIDTQWMYHAVGDVLTAHKILAADSRVDASKIGLTGISWGGVVTSIAIGYDNELAFAIPIYGSGHLTESLAPLGNNFKSESARKLWLAESRFDKVCMPVLWLCWNDDNCFSIQSNSHSYLDTYKNNNLTVLSIIDKMYHSHVSGWKVDESYFFADSIVKCIQGFPDINKPIPLNCKTKVYYITEPMTYSQYNKFGYGEYFFMTQKWKEADKIPPEAIGYYIEYTTTSGGKDYISCSPYKEI